jgi:biotin carboxylase
VRTVLFVFPTSWDARQLAACRGRWQDRFEPVFTEPTSEDVPNVFDILGFIDAAAAAWRGRVAGVTSSSDYPGATAAAAIRELLGLPGSPPSAVLGCSHKYASRLLQRDAVPEATPGFALVDSADPAAADVGFPCFVKPVKGVFSMLSRRVESREELVAFLSQDAVREFTGEYMRVFDQLRARYTEIESGGRFFVAEELLKGRQVTVEGFVAGGDVEILGVVDSVIERNSFVRFVYPSSLPEDVQERMRDVAGRLMTRSGLECSLFNVEMTYDDDADRVAVIEVNPRMCGQFADLYEKVDGVSGYEVALSLAVGERPRLERGAGPYAVAASFPLRTFEEVRVVRAPSPEDVAAAEAIHPGTLVWVECAAGGELADFDRYEDGFSCRYGIVNLGASDRDALLARYEEVRQRLGFELERL